MISAVDMSPSYERRKICQGPITNWGVDSRGTKIHSACVLDSNQLLARLADLEVKNVDIARVLRIPESRVSEMRAGKRRIKLDEAVKLVEAFRLEEASQEGAITPLTTPIARLLVLHVSSSVGAELPEEQVVELAADLRAFATFVSDPQVRDSVQAAGGFLKALQLRRRSGKVTPPAPRLRPAR